LEESFNRFTGRSLDSTFAPPACSDGLPYSTETSVEAVVIAKTAEHVILKRLEYDLDTIVTLSIRIAANRRLRTHRKGRRMKTRRWWRSPVWRQRRHRWYWRHMRSGV
jgi:hypothetical protein